MDFQKQVAKARSARFAGNQLQSLVKKIDKDDIESILKEDNFQIAMEDAYRQHLGEYGDNTGLGYSVRYNWHTGQKEMFVAGSQGWKDWTLNIVDGILYGAEKVGGKFIDAKWHEYTGLPGNYRPKLTSLDRYRVERSKKLKAIADYEDVDVIYGHSRGGAVVADLDVDARKVGVDAAMIIAENTDIENYHRPSVFDNVLGLSGKENETVYSGHGIHWAYGSN